MPRQKKKREFSEELEGIITKQVDMEYKVAKSAKSKDNADFESMIQMLECERAEKDYEWMSDYFYPELPSIILTDASSWANQYFQTREFVDAHLEGSAPEDKGKCKAAKKCINQTLNNRSMYHYHKYIRGRLINALAGQMYAICWWEKRIKKTTEYREGFQELGVDEFGSEILRDESGNILDPNQVPARVKVQVPIEKEQILVDKFNYEVIDPRNVFTDNKYCYSIQDKDFIIIRSETTYTELKEHEEECGYINLDQVKELMKGQNETETSKETYAKGENKVSSKIKNFDRLLRLGKMYVIIKEQNPEGIPTKVIPGYDTDGEPLDKAILLELIIETILVGSKNVLIRFQLNPFVDARGNTYRPVARGWCYIHPTKDVGLSDGKYLRESQSIINDGLNMGLDREKLATIPTLKGKKSSLEDNSTIYFAPEHVMQVENVDDIQEFKINSNIDSMLQFVGMVMQGDQKISAIFPTTMGDIPKGDPTATSIAGAEQKAGGRSNYKDLTWEYTFALDFYWIMLQMTYQFAEQETAIKMMGEDAQNFDADAEYSYTPVTTNIEQEYSKYRKLQILDQFIGRLVNVQNPQTMKLLNRLLAMSFELFGKELPDYKDVLLDENYMPPLSSSSSSGQGAGAGQMTSLSSAPTSNQSGVEQSGMEEYTRNGMNEGGF